MENKNNINAKIELIEQLLTELKNDFDNGVMGEEEEGSYENFLYNLRDL